MPAIRLYNNGCSEALSTRCQPLSRILHIPSEITAGTIMTGARSIWYYSSTCCGTWTARRIDDEVLEEKQKVHLDVKSIGTMLDARMTINRNVNSSSPSEKRLTGDHENRCQLRWPWMMPNMLHSEKAARDSPSSRISSMSSASQWSLSWSPINSDWSQPSRTDYTLDLRLHTLRPCTILQQIWLEMDRSNSAMYQLLR